MRIQLSSNIPYFLLPWMFLSIHGNIVFRKFLWIILTPHYYMASYGKKSINNSVHNESFQHVQFAGSQSQRKAMHKKSSRADSAWHQVVGGNRTAEFLARSCAKTSMKVVTIWQRADPTENSSRTNSARLRFTTNEIKLDCWFVMKYWDRVIYKFK